VIFRHLLWNIRVPGICELSTGREKGT